jgi:hypothetical protein
MKQCTKCKEVKEVEEFTTDKRSSDGRVSRCRVCKRKDNNKSYTENGRVLTPKQKKEKSERDVLYKRKRRGEDSLYRLGDNISRLIRKSINKGYKKGSSTYEILGIGETQFKEWIEGQWQEGMSWDNYGEWHLDHKIPISSGMNEEEKRKLNHYTNLQPLWAIDNLRKSNAYTEEDKRAYLEGLIDGE